MQIIHLILGKARPERSNGVTKVAHQLATHQTRLGHDVSIWGITPTPQEPIGEREYKTRFFQSIANKLSLDPALKTAIRSLKGQEIMFHLHGGFIPEFQVAARLIRKAGLRYSYTAHGAFNPLAMKQGKLRKQLFFTLFERNTLRHAHAVQFLGRMEFEGIEQFTQLSHKYLIPNGQDQEELGEVQRGEPSSDTEKRPVFSFCGRFMNRYKGLDLLLEAFAQYRRAGGRGIVWLIGDGEDRDLLQTQAQQLGIAEQVIFWGSKYGTEKLDLLAQSDVFVHPSRSEGFPTSVLEAAGLGLPCVVSTETNAGEYIASHHSGIHLAQNDVRHITAALHEMEGHFHKGSLREMGDNARNMVRDTFNWPRIASLVVDMYQPK
ncbi:MAG: glycosyltransferase family 1 protein [Bacteroidetes bacterium]|nr:MAG: glycosyltransferase family 1 protein [Bacteroidota bacterium]